jgi:hypothetical protein
MVKKNYLLNTKTTSIYSIYIYTYNKKQYKVSYAAGALCPQMKPEHIKSSSLIVEEGKVPGEIKHTRTSNLLNRSCELRHPAIKEISISF